MTPDAVRVLSAAGYLTEDARPSDGLVLKADAFGNPSDAVRLAPLMTAGERALDADAVFRVGTCPVIIFKSSESQEEDESGWHRLAWNAGAAPLLWVTTPQYVRLYDAYQPPREYDDRPALLQEFPLGASVRDALDAVVAACGRRHVAMGSFWRSDLARKIDRRSRIDNVLLHELGHLLDALVRGGLKPALAQKLVGRCVFVQYLAHRRYITEEEFADRFGAPDLSGILTDLDATYALYRWLRQTFKGDLFPIEDESSEREQLQKSASSLRPMADFFGRFNVSDGQGRFFPFRFDAIPVDLISSIYEQFVHSSDLGDAPTRGVHYTPINLVDLALDPVFEGLSGQARVIDPACGSGVFLVESLRRLVWLRTRRELHTRTLVRSVLMDQIRGIDISPAALSIAAFSLYLAVLELDPCPPKGIDALGELQFAPLVNHVLHARSAFDPGLVDALHRIDGSASFDVVFGNPPWTYSALEKSEDRDIASLEDAQTAAGEGNAEAVSNREMPEVSAADASEVNSRLRSGTTYARLRGVPIPPRSLDWPFVWRCRDLSHANTRIALILKATPFFSLEAATSKARDQLLRTFPNICLVNLSQLRTSGLFQEYEGESKGKRVTKRASGPALLFFSNCLPVNEGSLSAINLGWTPSFRRTGIFELAADPAKVVPLNHLAAEPALLKTSCFGTERDVWMLESLVRSERVVRLAAWLEDVGIPVGQGFQVGNMMPAAHLRGLPTVSAKHFAFPSLPLRLPVFESTTVHRARKPDIYRGPLVLLPEGRLSAAASVGRYTAVYDPRDLAFNESFTGVSFRLHGETLAKAFAALMNSKFIAYQVAMMGGTVGIKQTKVETADLERIRVPRLEALPSGMLAELAACMDDLIAAGERSAPEEVLSRLDELTVKAAGLNAAQRAIVGDADRRARAIFFETPAARAGMDTPPTREEVAAYEENLCTVFNGFALDDDDLVLVPAGHRRLAGDLLIARFRITERARASLADGRQISAIGLDDAQFSALGGSELPYLKPAKSLRLYTEDSVFILKPAHYRHFSPAAGQSDGDNIIADLMGSGDSLHGAEDVT